MGILADSTDKNNILTQNKFKYKSSSCMGELNNCYERCISLTDCYDAWIAVKTDTGEVFIYVEHNCGSEVKAIYDYIYTDFKDSPRQFFEKLDEIVTNVYERYNQKYEN